MGLEIPEEFWPITPIQTIPTSRITKDNNNKENKNEDNLKLSSSSSKKPTEDSSSQKLVVNDQEEEEECVTPKSEAQLLKTPLVCPPAPRKPRPAARKRKLSDDDGRLFSPQAYFQIPSSDIDFVFLEVITIPSKKIKV